MGKLNRVTTIATLSLSLFTNPSAFASHWNAPDTGFIIQIQSPNGIPQHSGQSALVSGTVTALGIDPDNGDDNGQNNRDKDV